MKKKKIRSKPKSGAASKAERRKYLRKEVLESFHVFLVIPRLGSHKIYLKDLSEKGLGFFTEVETSIEAGQLLSPVLFHVNPSLQFPLILKVAHITREATKSGDLVKKIGCEIVESKSKGKKAYKKFVELLDELTTFV